MLHLVVIAAHAALVAVGVSAFILLPTGQCWWYMVFGCRCCGVYQLMGPLAVFASSLLHLSYCIVDGCSTRHVFGPECVSASCSRSRLLPSHHVGLSGGIEACIKFNVPQSSNRVVSIVWMSTWVGMYGG